MNDIIWLTMRRLRTPLILMILVYSLSVFGMVFIPGQDEAGNPVRVGFLDAVYFIAILATTIGFGEVPAAFTHAQRLYVFIILFPNVIAWIYSIGTIISLFVDPQFRAVLARSRFARKVRRQNRDFYIICGFGNTGRMIVRGLLRRDISAWSRMLLFAAATIWPPSLGGSPRQLVTIPPAPSITGMSAATSWACSPVSATMSIVPADSLA